MNDGTTTFFVALAFVGIAFVAGFLFGADDMRDHCLDALSNAEMQCFDTDHCIIGASGKWVRTANGWKKGVTP